MKNKNKKKHLILIVVISTILTTTFMISLINILFWHNDNVKNEENLKEINKIVKVEEKENTTDTELVNKPLDVNDDYWYYTTIPLIDVNISDLKKKNNDTIGWINVNNTNINYPFVQSKDNDYYLHHSYDKKYNNAGWVFLDYRNNKKLTDKNNIIYGHHRVNNTMFTSLLDALNNDWYTNKDNHIIRLSLEEENTMWQIISVYKIPVESYYITVNFTDNEFQNFIDTILERSIYNFNSKVTTNDNILTLSTCFDDNNRVVVHAKLIKKEKRN